jgi:ribosomal protein S1
VQARVRTGLAVLVYGLNALLPIGQVQGICRTTPADEVDLLIRARLGQEMQVRVLRMEADAGHIIVSERLANARQLAPF